MPIHRHRCERCGETFEQSESLSRQVSEQVGWQPAPVFAVTAKTS